MKKLLIFVLFIFIAPLSVNALDGTVNPSFDTDTCTLTVTGKQDGHDAVVSLSKNGTPTGINTGTIDENNDYSITFTLTYDSETIINIKSANELGENETESVEFTVPACEIEDVVNNEIFDNDGNSLIINDSDVGFDDGDDFELEKVSYEQVLQMLEALEGSEDYDALKMIFDKIMENVGPYREFAYYLKLNIRKNLDHYNKGFILNAAMPKEIYDKLKGLKIELFDENTLEFAGLLNYEYDKENEVISINVPGPCIMIAYLDNDYKFIDDTENPIYGKKKDSNLTVKIDADFSKLKDVYLNDKKVDPKNYKSSLGSTVITFNKDYMQSLALGKYDLVVYFSDGSAKTTLTVVEDANSPKTLDNIKKHVTMFEISVVGLIGVSIYIINKKRKSKNA